MIRKWLEREVFGAASWYPFQYNTSFYRIRRGRNIAQIMFRGTGRLIVAVLCIVLFVECYRLYQDNPEIVDTILMNILWVCCLMAVVYVFGDFDYLFERHIKGWGHYDRKR